MLKETGCEVTVKGDEITCVRVSSLHGVKIDVGDIPDLFLVIVVLFSTVKGRFRLYGASYLRFKESDKMDLAEKMLGTLGASIAGTDDGCIINGVPGLRGGKIEYHGDHRMFMAGP